MTIFSIIAITCGVILSLSLLILILYVLGRSIFLQDYGFAFAAFCVLTFFVGMLSLLGYGLTSLP